MANDSHEQYQWKYSFTTTRDLLVDVKLGRRVANGLCDYGAVWTETFDINRNFANLTLDPLLVPLWARRRTL